MTIAFRRGERSPKHRCAARMAVWAKIRKFPYRNTDCFVSICGDKYVCFCVGVLCVLQQARRVKGHRNTTQGGGVAVWRSAVSPAPLPWDGCVCTARQRRATPGHKRLVGGSLGILTWLTGSSLVCFTRLRATAIAVPWCRDCYKRDVMRPLIVSSTSAINVSISSCTEEMSSIRPNALPG